VQENLLNSPLFYTLPEEINVIVSVLQPNEKNAGLLSFKEYNGLALNE